MIRVFLYSLRFRWFEYLLGAALIALPVAALTAYRSLSSVSQGDVHELAHNLGKNMLVIPASGDLAARYSLRYADEAMPASYPSRIQSSALGQHVRSIEARLHGAVNVGGRSLLIIGERSYGQGGGFALRDGQAIVGPVAARRLGLQVGSPLVIGNLHFTISAIAPPGNEELDDAVVVPLSQAQQVLGRPESIDTMRLAGCWCRIDVPTLGEKIERLLPGTRALTLAGMLRAQQGTVSAVQRHGTLLYAIASALIGAIAMVVVSSQVRRQARELGLLAAIGTRPTFIVLLFVVRAGLMGAIGASVGYLLGFPLTSELGSRWMGVPVPVAAESLASLVAIATLACVSAALIPALRGIRLDPTKVLNEV